MHKTSYWRRLLLTLFASVIFGISLFILAMSNDGYKDGVLSMPFQIPFAKDRAIRIYSQGSPLTRFKYSGDWTVKEIDNKVSIVGVSVDSPNHLISLDKLSKEPKFFKFDFIIEDFNKEYGFFFDNVGIIVVNNKMYPAKFDAASNNLIPVSKNGRNFSNRHINTLAINTGHDNTCVMWINGRGFELEYNNRDNPFGVYMSTGNGIIINNFRWAIGNT